MKKILFLITAIALSFTYYTAYSVTVCYEDSPGGGTHDWNSNKSNCPISGHFCKKTVTVTEPKQVDIEFSATYNGVFITTTFEGIDFDVTNDPVHGTFTSHHNGKNYTFGVDEYIFIQTSTEYPSLNNLGVSLEGITTDGNGEYTVFVPLP
ncbi:MAG: hypothetical protein KC414_00900 [Romboutsia sp.]|nr:hypothetical protein [Romboutsia sp.]MCB9221320.1 hypothetical protein [Ignavibacteria bacterium]